MGMRRIFFGTANTAAFIPLRLGVGVVMAAHGAQKLFGWFGGPGLAKTAENFSEQLGLEPGMTMAALAGGAEFFGGLFVLVGFLTRLSGLAVAATMGTAIVVVHPDAFFAANNGMEYPLTLMLGSLTLAIGGPGALSFDQKLAARGNDAG